MHMAAFRAMGASPVPMVWGEVYTSLQQGVIDGQENAPVILTTNALWEVQDYYALTNHVYAPQVFLMSGSTASKLSDADMNVIRKAAMDATHYQRKLMAEQTDGHIQTLIEKGVEVYEVDGALFQAAAKAVYDEYESVFGKDLIESIIATAM